MNSGFGSPSAQAFSIFESDKTSPHQFITSSAAGGLSVKSNISGSGNIFGGSAMTASVVFQDQYQNVGSGSITVALAKIIHHQSHLVRVVRLYPLRKLYQAHSYVLPVLLIRKVIP